MRHPITTDCVFGADFETDYVKVPDHPDLDKAWICQWAMSNGTTEQYGTNLHGF